tara:strand:- start:108 stop:617 length:510 start_codon:yes stop_codon:yes gene_type:complete
MIPYSLKQILLDVASLNERTSLFRRTFFILFLANLIWSIGYKKVWGEATDFKTYRQAAQQKIIWQQGIIEQDPMDFQSYFELGLAYLNLGRHKEEVQAYKEALSLNPKSALVHFNLSIAYDYLNNGSKAIHHMQRANHLYAKKRNHRKIRATQRHLKRFYLSYPGLSMK